jgi:hypothetical protein
MIAFFKAHKRAITLLLVLAWAGVPLIMEQSFDLLSLGVNVIFIASQVFWFRFVGELGKKLIGNKSWRPGLAAAGLIVYAFLLIFNLLTWWDASKGSTLTLRAALLEAPFRWWLFGLLLGFLLIALFWITDRVIYAFSWAFKKLSISQGGDLPSPSRRRVLKQTAAALRCTLCGRSLRTSLWPA